MSEQIRPLTVAEYEPLARARVEPGAWDYQAGGAGDELSLADNVAAWNRIKLRPRVLVDRELALALQPERTALLVVDAGAMSDPAGEEGVAALTAPALLEGTAHRSGVRRG